MAGVIKTMVVPEPGEVPVTHLSTGATNYFLSSFHLSQSRSALSKFLPGLRLMRRADGAGRTGDYRTFLKDPKACNKTMEKVAKQKFGNEQVLNGVGPAEPRR